MFTITNLLPWEIIVNMVIKVVCGTRMSENLGSQKIRNYGKNFNYRNNRTVSTLAFKVDTIELVN